MDWMTMNDPCEFCGSGALIYFADEATCADCGKIQSENQGDENEIQD
jgi:hypothetical protein